MAFGSSSFPYVTLSFAFFAALREIHLLSLFVSYLALTARNPSFLLSYSLKTARNHIPDTPQRSIQLRVLNQSSTVLMIQIPCGDLLTPLLKTHRITANFRTLPR